MSSYNLYIFTFKKMFNNIAQGKFSRVFRTWNYWIGLFCTSPWLYAMMQISFLKYDYTIVRLTKPIVVSKIFRLIFWLRIENTDGFKACKVGINSKQTCTDPYSKFFIFRLVNKICSYKNKNKYKRKKKSFVLNARTPIGIIIRLAVTEINC